MGNRGGRREEDGERKESIILVGPFDAGMLSLMT